MLGECAGGHLPALLVELALYYKHAVVRCSNIWLLGLLHRLWNTYARSNHWLSCSSESPTCPAISSR
ncbi:hypothetical protein EUGRSUZ_J02509 [Eucalyptus grandis]|uniref:Uncharacterized protein n=2 Tax=Eucalyptus grandis TaxID=71139 RepID=A0ACC3J8X6_EUCGR|nr:hypothetical protein EUGRSUZ_J02509 [Eucalyptus grandis]